MANLSDFFGTCTFDKKDLARVKLLFKITSRLTYDTHAENLDDPRDMGEKYQVSIWGNGRWTAYSNITNIFEQAISRITEYNNPPIDLGDLSPKDVNFDDLTLEFKFRDLEMGCDVFYDMNIVVTCLDGETIIEKESETNLVICARNLESYFDDPIDTFTDYGIEWMKSEVRAMCETMPSKESNNLGKLNMLLNESGLTNAEIIGWFADQGLSRYANSFDMFASCELDNLKFD